MAQFKYEGDLGGLNSDQLDFISKVLTELGFKSDIVEVTQVGLAGDNYQSTVKRVTINDFKLIAKIAPANESVRVQMNTENVFGNEAIIYEVLLPKFDELQKSAGIEKPITHAKCYGILKEKPNEMILLEDLTVNGFKTLNRLEPLTDECIRLVIKDFALYHSLSFVLKQKEPEVFQHLCSNLQNIYTLLNDTIITGMEMAEAQMLAVVDKEELVERVKGSMKNSFVKEVMKFTELEKEDAEAGKTVIIQGDAWTNNMLFKFENEKVTNFIMIDYQISREGNPLTDLNYLIFNCSDYQTRNKNYHTWINLYYKELTKSLAIFNINSDDIYTRETLDSDMKRYSRLALANGLMFNGIGNREKEEAFDFQKELELNGGVKTDKIFEKISNQKLTDKTVLRMRERLTGLIQSFIDLGYI